MTTPRREGNGSVAGLYGRHPVELRDDGTLLAWTIPMILSDRSGAPVQDPRRLSRAVERGDLVRVRPGAYADRTAWNSAYPMNRYLATVLAIAASRRAGPAVFCREAALVLHGIGVWSCPREISVRTGRVGSSGMRRPRPATGSTHAPFAERHRLWPRARDRGAARAAPADASVELVLGGVRLQVERLDLVLADTIPHLVPVEAAVVLDALLAGRPGGLRKEGVLAARPWELEELLSVGRLCTSGAAADRFRHRALFATGGTESPGESVSRSVIRDLGFEVPETQHRVRDGRGELLGITDFWWRGAAIVGEYDGMGKYLGRRSYSGLPPDQVIARERRREDAICDQGLVMVRWLTEDLRRPALLEAKLARAGVPRATRRPLGEGAGAGAGVRA